MLKKIMLFFTICITSAFLFIYGVNNNTFYGDALGYYLYLPSAAVYNNLKTPYALPRANGIEPGVLWYLGQMKHNCVNARGYALDQYTYGVALMESPFFFIVHVYEKASGGKANGYTGAYAYLIKAGNLLYAILGLLLVYKILRRYFTDTQSMLSACCLLLCTNLFYFSVYQAGMSHVILFFLYALVMYLAIKIQERPAAVIFFVTGLSTGIITLTRPTDVLCLLIPLLYGVYNRETVRARINFLKDHRFKILLATGAFVLPIIPQLLYWKMITGSYICYSYGNQSFNWAHPKILEGLFYFSNGWLPYAPVMIFSLLGLFCYRKIKKWAWCIWAIVPVYIYIIYSWYCYTYLNGLGSRPMIHLYPLMAIPLTAFIAFISRKKLFIKTAFATIIIFFIALNVSYSLQEVKGLLDSVESNMAYNSQILFRFQLRYEDLVTRDLDERQPDTAMLHKTATLLSRYFDDSLSANYMQDKVGNKYAYHMTTEDYVNIGSVIFDKEKFGNARWFKVDGRFMCPVAPDYFMHLLTLDIKDKVTKYCKIENKIYDNNPPASTITLEHWQPNTWGHVCFFTAVPKNLKNGDEIKLFVWNTGKREMYMDSVCLELYR